MFFNNKKAAFGGSFYTKRTMRSLELDTDAHLTIEVAFKTAFRSNGHLFEDGELEAQCDDQRTQNRRNRIDPAANRRMAAVTEIIGIQ